MFLRNASALLGLRGGGTKAQNICCELSVQGEEGLKEKRHLGCSLKSDGGRGGTVGRLERPASANHTATVRYRGLLDPGSADFGGDEARLARPVKPQQKA